MNHRSDENVYTALSKCENLVDCKYQLCVYVIKVAYLIFSPIFVFPKISIILICST